MKYVYTSSLLAIISFSKVAFGSDFVQNGQYELEGNDGQAYYYNNHNGQYYNENEPYDEEIPEIYQVKVPVVQQISAPTLTPAQVTSPQPIMVAQRVKAPEIFAEQAPIPVMAVRQVPAPMQAPAVVPGARSIVSQVRNYEIPAESKKERSRTKKMIKRDKIQRMVRKLFKADKKAVNIARTINSVKATNPELASKLTVKLDKIKARIQKLADKLKSKVDPIRFDVISTSIKIYDPKTDLTAKPTEYKKLTEEKKVKKMTRKLLRADFKAVNLARAIYALKNKNPQLAQRLSAKFEKTKSRISKILAKIQTKVDAANFQKVSEKVKINDPKTDLTAKPLTLKQIKNHIIAKKIQRRIRIRDRKSVNLARAINAAKGKDPKLAQILKKKLDRNIRKLRNSLNRLKKRVGSDKLDKIISKIRILSPSVDLKAAPTPRKKRTKDEKVARLTRRTLKSARMARRLRRKLKAALKSGNRRHAVKISKIIRKASINRLRALKKLSSLIETDAVKAIAIKSHFKVPKIPRSTRRKRIYKNEYQISKETGHKHKIHPKSQNVKPKRRVERLKVCRGRKIKGRVSRKLYLIRKLRKLSGRSISNRKASNRRIRYLIRKFKRCARRCCDKCVGNCLNKSIHLIKSHTAEGEGYKYISGRRGMLKLKIDLKAYDKKKVKASK
ncbi:hypothetical protein AYI69_g22 [Smittium culicis]|uniref:C2H2-type domain-containing protein n=1 Tax=Smittium culicis TaxID=133412 RepID=A0A1R1YUG4_9FUNG|nr:hypothetical protein AYI69_g22 [Smittium culicis]